jgi:molecular chaperone GrpE
MTKKIKIKTKKCPDCQVLKEKLSRSLADYDNLLKRIDQQKERIIKLASASLVDKLLGVVDDFDRAQDHLKDPGLKIALDQFLSVLYSEGVEEIQALKKAFDPESMDCAQVKKGKKDLVLEVLQKGYTLNGQVLRPAKVVVGSGN